jgi:ParB family chromosome partitioning protein
MALEGRRGLGRGLSALLGETEAPVAPGGPSGARDLPIELIKPNPGQPRTHFDPGELEELASSMRQKGVLQPILVRPHGDGEYQIVAGERRWRAAQKAGLSAMPALVRELSDVETLEIALIENIQRSDLNAIDEAAAYQTLMTLGDATQEAVAETVGKSRSHVANTLRLLQLPGTVQTLVRAGRLSAGHARALVGAPEPEVLASRIIEQGLNVRETEALARKAASPEPGSPAKPARGKSADTQALERDLSERLGLTVEITDRNGSGDVRIHYRSLEQLDDLCRRLSGR